MIKVIEFAFTGYPVTDMARARQFYESVLGLKPASTWEHEGKSWIEYEVGPSCLALTNLAPEWRPSTQGPSLALEVENFDAAVAELKRIGARFTVEPMESPACRLAVILDPDGNSLAIHKRNPA